MQTSWFKALQATLLAVVVCFSMGASDASSRFVDLGHRLMCSCGCSQLLGECNHVGCPESGRERKELSDAIAAGQSDQQILNWFATKYGTTVLAAPPGTGFNMVAWIAPFAVLAAALTGTFLLIKRWSGIRQLKEQNAAPVEAASTDPAERERMERIRRETGSDGGF
jgi:cytochrome c-type biogenesis protein CcmH